MKKEDYKNRIIGKRFGYLTVESFYGHNKYKSFLYKCKCDCGNYCLATYSDLKSGRKDNCGCKRSERIRRAKEKFNKYDISGDYGIGYTSNTNKEFYFDLEDYDKIRRYCWIEHDNYIESNPKGTTDKKSNIKLHRFIMGATKFTEKVDHINHNTFDNRKENLRICSNQKNSFNHKIHSNNSTGYSGITYNKENNKYRARIFINKKGIHLGYFENIEDAVKARREAEEKYFKEYKIDERYE